MKILVLDANVKYINPTRLYLPYLLKTLGTTFFFGPGYVSREELNAGLPSYIEKYGPFDIAIHTEQALPRQTWEGAASRFNKNVFDFYFSGNVATFSSYDLATFWSEVAFSFDLIPLNVLSLLLWDYQGTTDFDFAYFVDKFDLVLGLGTEHWCQTTVEKESMAFGYSATSNWSLLIENNYQKIHSLVHFIAPQEFCFDVLSERSAEWSVLGVSYEARKFARRYLSAANIDVQSGKGFNHYYRAARYKMGFPVKNTKERLNELNSSFSRVLHNSKFSYTCGSSYKMPIRKFFEIPAAGAVLVCDPCNGLEALGFVDGVNCIIAKPEELPEVNTMLQEDVEKAESIARQGQNLILREHTLEARSAHIREGLKRLLKGEFFGSYWETGELKYRTGSTTE